MIITECILLSIEMIKVLFVSRTHNYMLVKKGQNIKIRYIHIKIHIYISRFTYIYQDSNIYIKIRIYISRFGYICQDSHIYIKIHIYIYRFTCIYQDSHVYIKIHLHISRFTYTGCIKKNGAHLLCLIISKLLKLIAQF